MKEEQNIIHNLMLESMRLSHTIYLQSDHTMNELPPAFTIVLITRKTGDKYYGYRTDAPLSTNKDASRECHWYGRYLNEGLVCDRMGKLQFGFNFSDVTVKEWQLLGINNTNSLTQ